MQRQHHPHKKVSVVVPVFNGEDYLPECLDSLIAQTLDGIEIVIVDDGSTDNSGAIADRYSDEHGLIKVIHQNNQGLGPARNSGITVSEGEYIGFVDADDWVEPCMYEELYDSAFSHSSDICYSGYKKVYSNKSSWDYPHPLANRTINHEREISHFHLMMYGNSCSGEAAMDVPISCWNAIYRRDFLNDHSLRFRNIRSEDRDFNVRCTRYANCIVFDDGCYYCYRKQGQSSITSAFGKQTISDYMHLIDTLTAEIANESEEISSDCYKRLMNTSAELSLDLLRACSNKTKPFSPERNNLLKELEAQAAIRGLFSLDDFESSKSNVALYNAVKAVGIDTTSFVLGVKQSAIGKMSSIYRSLFPL